MPATLLVLDIDGTLRPHGEPRVPKENADALHTVQKAGVKLVIATGRCRAEIPAKMLRGIRPDYWICAAGAQVEDAAGTALYIRTAGMFTWIMRPSICRRKPLHWKAA